MKSNLKQYSYNIIISVSIIVGSIVSTVSQVYAKNDNQKIIPLNAKSYGKTYAEWSAEGWKWLYSMPVDKHPLFDTADCNEGQSGKVFFLGGTFITVPGENGEVIGTANRDCVVPVGKAIFFPIIDAECATLEGNGSSEAELRSCAKSLMDHAIDLTAEVDGVTVQDLQAYRMQSPLFTWGPLPDNNLFQDPINFPEGATSPSVSDGAFLLLAPLSAGAHTLHFSGKVIFSTAAGDPIDFIFLQDITYNLTVAPGKP